MAKKSRKEFLAGISNIVEDNLSQSSNDNAKRFGIRKHVIGLLEAGQKNPKLMSYLNKYDNILKDKSTKEFMIYEQFGKGLISFSNVKAVKETIAQMNENLMENGNILKFYKLLETVEDEKAKSVVKECYDNFIANNDYESQETLMDALDALCETGEPAAPKLIIILTDTDNLPQIELGTPESKFDEIQKKLKDDAQRRKIQDIQNQINDYANKVFDDAQAENEDEAIAEQEANCFDAVVGKRSLCLEKSIKTIAKSDAKTNARLMEVLNQYAGALNQGLYEERLYEGFIRNMTPFDYLLPVEKEIKRINEAVKENAVSVELTKILEEMSSTDSYYLIPIIEEDVCRYINSASDVNKAQAKAALAPYATDPYCHAMLETIENFTGVKSLKEEVLSMKDKLNVLKENATVSNIYSPIQYIKDGECVFNANGQFFVKKGNTLATLSDEYLPQLSESFVALCQLINDPHVYINDDADDSITLLGKNKVANIFEGYVTVNGNRETVDTLRNLNEMAMKYDFDNNFFIMASCLLENFNKIAKVDFAKHIQLNENNGINVDLFRLNNTIFINAVNEVTGSQTFYQNVNPLQCKSIINSHMGLNVSALFEDLLPSQDKILMKLNEAKDGYEEAIDKYETTLEKLKAAKESCSNEDNSKKLDDAIESAQTKLDELKKEYSEWQKEVDKEVNAKDTDDEKETPEDGETKDGETKDGEEVEQPQSEPIDANDVDDAKPSLVEPMTGNADAATNEEDPVISDDEFNSYLDNQEDAEGGAETPAEDLPDPDEVKDLPTEEPVNDTDLSDDDILPSAAPETDDDNSNDPTENQEGDGFEETELSGDAPISSDEQAEIEEVPADNGEDIDIVSGEEDGDIDAVAGPTDPYNGEEGGDDLMTQGFKIANVSFDQNIKTNEVYNTGNVIVIIPKVGADGRMVVEPETFTFYIDATTKQPIIDAEDIPVAVYNEILNAITADPMFVKGQDWASQGGDENPEAEVPAEDEGPKPDVEANPAVGTYIDAKDAEEISNEIEANDDNEFFNIKDDENGLTISPKEGEEPAEPETPEDDDDDINIITGGPKVAIESGDDDTNDSEDVIPSDKTPELPDDLFGDGDETGDDEDDEAIATSIFSSDEPDDEPVTPQDAPTEPAEKPIEASEEDEDEPMEITIPTYKSKDGKTDIEYPAPDASTNESKKPKLHESILDIKGFFVNEGASKPSKKEVKSIEFSNPKFKKIQEDSRRLRAYMEGEIEDEPVPGTFADLNVAAFEAMDTYGIKLTAISRYENIGDNGGLWVFFVGHNDKDDYAIYLLNNKIYYRKAEEMVQILEDNVSESPESTAAELESDIMTGEPLDYISEDNLDDAQYMFDAIISSITGVVNESIKIRRPKLSSHGDVDQSKQMDEIVNGTKEDKEFKEKIDKDATKNGVENPMMPAAQPAAESVAPSVLPNVHQELSESDKSLKDLDIEYEPMDWVIIKATKMKGQVQSLVTDYDGNVTLLNIVASDGNVYSLKEKDIQPDPMYLQNVGGVMFNSQNTNVPRLAQFDINPKTRMPNKLKNDKPGEMKDLNGKDK